jgi:protein O-mannosyl-transferase
MAKLSRREKHIHPHSISGQEQEKKISVFKKPGPYAWGLFLILIISFLVYLPALNAGFVWDDVNYIERNPQIHSINLGQIFSGYVMGNYHPLTMLTLSIEYQLFGQHATGYHIVNLLLHLGNVALVFYAVFLLSKKSMAALVAALLFGIHPLHVESVAWASELKDLLYTFFFLGAYISYLLYLKDHQRKFYFLALLLFLASLLSKAMAASLPVLLLITDYFTNRKLNVKAWVEKAPFFLLAVIFGVVAVLAQQSSESIQDIAVFTIPQRIIFACYGFITYLWKLIIPFHLSAFYPYPVKSGASLPALYYVYPLLLVGLAACIIYSRRFTRNIIFGAGFFAITVFLVLQLLPVGDAVMADRYSYIPSIGIFYLAGEGFYWLWSKNRRAPALAILSVFTIFFAITTLSRTGVWKNGITLWNDVIRKYPGVATAYNNRGGTYLNEKKYEEALTDFNKAIELRPGYAEALNNRGNVLSGKKRYEEALKDYNKAIELQNDYAGAYNNRGLIFMQLNRYPEAVKDFNKAIELQPGFAEAYYNRGLLYMNEKKSDLALIDYNKALELNPGYTEAFINRRSLLGGGAKPEEALADYNKAIESKQDDPQLYYSRGSLLISLNRNAEALKDINKALELKPDYAEAHNARGNLFMIDKKTEEALAEYNIAIKQMPDFAEAYVNRANIFREQNKDDLALSDYNKAIQLNPALPYAYYNRGILLIRQKKFEEVINEYAKVIELKGDSAMSYYNKGMAEFFLNKKDIACSDLKLAAAMGNKAAADAYNNFCK